MFPSNFIHRRLLDPDLDPQLEKILVPDPRIPNPAHRCIECAVLRSCRSRNFDTSVGDTEPDPHVFMPPGSGSISRGCGSGSGSGYFPFLINMLS